MTLTQITERSSRSQAETTLHNVLKDQFERAHLQTGEVNTNVDVSVQRFEANFLKCISRTQDSATCQISLISARPFPEVRWKKLQTNVIFISREKS